VLIAPILPGLSDRDDQLEEVVQACVDAGAVSVSAVALHLRPGVREHFMGQLAKSHPQLVADYERRYRRAYLPAAESQALSQRVQRMVERARGRARGKSAHPSGSPGPTLRRGFRLPPPLPPAPATAPTDDQLALDLSATS
jgi:DNA repair photolyase